MKNMFEILNLPTSVHEWKQMTVVEHKNAQNLLKNVLKRRKMSRNCSKITKSFKNSVLKCPKSF